MLVQAVKTVYPLFGFALAKEQRRYTVRRYRTLAHVTYLCQFHIVFCPKYRYRVLRGQVGRYVRNVIRQICEWKEVEIEEGHVSQDHVHLLLSIPPKYSVSHVVGTVKGRTAIRVLKRFPDLVRRSFRRSLWSRGYFVSTVGVNEAIIRRYVRHQEMREREAEQLGLDLSAPYGGERKATGFAGGLLYCRADT